MDTCRRGLGVTQAPLYRVPVFLRREDWAYLLMCWENRRRRIRSQKTRDRYSSVDREMSGASADASPDEDGEWKYVLHLTEADYLWLWDSLRFARKAERDDEKAKRIETELSAARGDMTEVE